MPPFHHHTLHLVSLKERRNTVSSWTHLFPNLVQCIQLKGSSQVFYVRKVITSRSKTRNYSQLDYDLNVQVMGLVNRKKLVTPPIYPLQLPSPTSIPLLLHSLLLIATLRSACDLQISLELMIPFSASYCAPTPILYFRPSSP